MVTFFPFSAFVPDGGHYGRELDRAKNVLPIHRGFRSLRKKLSAASVADGPMTGTFVHIYQAADMEQSARPMLDTLKGTWQPSSGANLFDRLNEETASDAELMWNAPPNAGFAILQLSAVTTPGAGAQKMRWRYRIRDVSPLFGHPHTITSITRSAGTATATTFAAHGLSTGNTIVLSGADQVEYNVLTNITVTGANAFTFAVTGTPVTPATGALQWQATVERAVTSITRVGAVATVTTTAAHGFSTGFWIGMNGANQPEYNGAFQITVLNATQFTYAVTGAPATPATGTITAQLAYDATLNFLDDSLVQRATATVRAAVTMANFVTSETNPVPVIGNWAKTFYSFVVGNISGSPQYMRPSTDGSAVGVWTTQTGATTGLAATLDELDADDSDYIQSGMLAPGQTSSQVVKLADSSSPVTPGQAHVVRYRYFAANAGMNLTVYLVQGGDDAGTGGTIVQTWTHTGIAAGSWVTASQSFTPAAGSAFMTAGYVNLKLKFEATYPATAGSTVPQSLRATGSVSSSGFLFTGAASLTAAINEVSPSDAEYIYSTVFAGSPDSAFALAAGVDPNISTDHTLKVRAWKLSNSASTISAFLRQGPGGPVITAVSITPTFTPTTTAYTLTAAEAAAITEYGSLVLEFFTGAQDAVVGWAELSVATGRQLRISWAELELPPKARVEVSWAEYRVPSPDARYRGDLPTRFCGSKKNLFAFDTTGFTDVSRGGPVAPGAGPYGAAGNIPGAWYLASWGNNVIATNFQDPVQWRPNNTGQFVDMISTGTDKPKARFVCAARDHVMLGGINLTGHEADEVWWSSFQNASLFDRSTATQCDSRRLYATPGQIMGMVGGDTPLVFKRRSLFALQWVGGVLVWQPIVVSRSVGTPYPKSVAPGQDQVLWWGGDCFYSIVEGGKPQPLGRGIVSRYLTDAAFSEGAIKQIDPIEARVEDQVMEGVFDPSCGLFVWKYQGVNDNSWQHSRGILYDPAEDRWALVDIAGANMSSIAQLPNTTTSATNELKGVLGVDWDGVNTTWFRFDSGTTYQATFRSKTFAVQLDDQERPMQVQIEGLLPVFSTVLGSGGAWPEVTVTVEMALDPRFIDGYQTETYTSGAPFSDQRRMLPFRLAGVWCRISITVAEMTAAIMDAFEGVYLDWVVRGRGGA